jgi:hypothetical protein
LLNLLRQSALIERAALSGRRRHKAAHANTIGNSEWCAHVDQYIVRYQTTDPWVLQA